MEKNRVINGIVDRSIYTTEWLENNPSKTIGWVLIDKYDGDFIKPILVDGVVVEGATDEEIEQKYILEAKRNETELYKKRQIDGINAYAEISAEFRLAKLSGLLSEEQHGQIESVLIPVRNEVLAGQWISAINILEEIGTSIGSELYDRLHNQITNYINENY